eukprot:Hpha_TRINITY_DN4856_c0_g1::TRINITY_DN4856_c0_g1_i1::g.20316::m.20316/K03259/EIF4E; translation initiation factor 4E
MADEQFQMNFWGLDVAEQPAPAPAAPETRRYVPPETKRYVPPSGSSRSRTEARAYDTSTELASSWEWVLGLPRGGSKKWGGEVNSVELFWTTYSHLKRPGATEKDGVRGCPPGAEISLFLSEVDPEHLASGGGGKVCMLFGHDESMVSHAWEALLLHSVGAQWCVAEKVLGVRFSRRTERPSVQLWTEQLAASEQECLNAEFKALLTPFQQGCSFEEFRPHHVGGGQMW